MKFRNSRVSGPFWVRFGSGLILGLGLGLVVGLGLRPYLDPTRKCSLARKHEQPTAPKTRATRSLGDLSNRLVLVGVCV